MKGNMNIFNELNGTYSLNNASINTIATNKRPIMINFIVHIVPNPHINNDAEFQQKADWNNLENLGVVFEVTVYKMKGSMWRMDFSLSMDVFFTLT